MKSIYDTSLFICMPYLTCSVSFFNPGYDLYTHRSDSGKWSQFIIWFFIFMLYLTWSMRFYMRAWSVYPHISCLGLIIMNPGKWKFKIINSFFFIFLLYLTCSARFDMRAWSVSNYSTISISVSLQSLGESYLLVATFSFLFILNSTFLIFFSESALWCPLQLGQHRLPKYSMH